MSIRVFEYFDKSDLARFSFSEKAEIEKACQFAEKLHYGQIRRSGEAFIEHPLAVAKILLDWGSPSNMVIAAILHDILEDSLTTVSEIEQQFNDEVLLYVFALTKDTLEKDDLQKNLLFLSENPNILVIKLADRLHNMRTMDTMPPKKQIEKSQETQCLYLPIARQLGMFAVADELKMLSRKYTQGSVTQC
jgi:GTP pyrophosphokinase